MKYLNKSFSVGTENSAAYRDNYDRIFGKKSKPEKQPEIERCHECGSWEAQCSAPGPVPGCACARCLRAALQAAELRDRLNYERAEKAERERDEARMMREMAERFCNVATNERDYERAVVARLTRERDEVRQELEVAQSVASANGHAALVVQRKAAERQRDEAWVELEQARRERDEARALLQAATDNAFDAGAKAQGLEDAHVAVRLRKQLRECVRVIEGMLPPGDESVGIPEFPPVSPGDAWECVLRTRELLKGCGA